jgi:hypothetical protein
VRRRWPWLLIGVAVVVVCSRLIGGDDPEPAGEAGEASPAESPAEAPASAGATPAASPLPAGSPSTGPSPAPPPPEDGEVTAEEALDSAAVPGAVLAAERFVQEWSTPDSKWPARLAGLATRELVASLVPPDPYQVSGPGFVLFDAPEWARIGVPADGGTIVLDLTMVDGEWLVSALDWWPSGGGGP